MSPEERNTKPHLSDTGEVNSLEFVPGTGLKGFKSLISDRKYLMISESSISLVLVDTSKRQLMCGQGPWKGFRSSQILVLSDSGLII